MMSGYPSWKGQIFNGEQISTVFDGIEVNNLSNYNYLLTGYMNSPTTLRAVLNIYKRIKEKNPSLKYFCDPVLGDNGKLYVTEELINIYKEEVITNADYLLPNQTECQLLTGKSINNEEEAIVAMDALHSKGINTIVIKSLDFVADRIDILASTIDDKGNKIRFKSSVPKYPRYFTGTGDLFAALFLGWIAKGDNVKTSLEKTVNSLFSVLTNTVNAGSSELKLIQSKKDIEEPKNQFVIEIK